MNFKISNAVISPDGILIIGTLILLTKNSRLSLSNAEQR